MSLRRVDACVIGQGLAGTAVAWQLHLRGASLVILDDPHPSSASRISAGLMTSITGPKLAKTWSWDLDRPYVEEFYRRVETILGIPVFEPGPSLHLFRNEAERARFELRMESDEYRQLARFVPPEELPSAVCAPWGGFEMTSAARLNVRVYLNASRSYFEKRGEFRRAVVDMDEDFEVGASGIRLPRWGLEVGQVYFCGGYPFLRDRIWGKVRFNPSKGELLTLTIPGWIDRRPIHAGVWLAPVGEGEFRSGSTFEWKQLDRIVTEQGRIDLLQRLQTWLTCPVEVLAQHAAVRPTMHDFKPVIGRHPDEPRFAILNGLGTKGALMAPRLAGLLVDQILDGREIPAELDVMRWFR